MVHQKETLRVKAQDLARGRGRERAVEQRARVEGRTATLLQVEQGIVGAASLELLREPFAEPRGERVAAERVEVGVCRFVPRDAR